MLNCTARKPDPSNTWTCPEGMHPLIFTLLKNRGIGSDEEARLFLHPGVECLRDPFLLSDMHEAVRVIKDAVAKGESICVYGDYDVDGVCASAILNLYLKSIGAKTEVYLPSRHNEGYGLNEEALESISKRHKLLVTVDCGITAVSLVESAKKMGMRVVVTDHHKPDEVLPDCPVINPLLKGYPFGFLCGAGVAFQLVSALGGREEAMQYIDLAALATIADIVPLKDENRAIAVLGLRKLNAFEPRPGIRALIDVSGLTGKEIGAGNVSFQLTPRLNASGRLGDAMRAYDLLTSYDRDLCEKLANELNDENLRRKELENAAIDEAEKLIADFDFAHKRVLIVEGENWNSGVIGLAASRLTEKYHYPSVVLTRDGDYYTGSCRSIDGVDIQEALTHVGYLMERFGGHKMAAGLKLKSENLPEFKEKLNEYLMTAYNGEIWIPSAEYDAKVEPGELTVELVNLIDSLAPTGCGNPGALFLSEADILSAYPVGKEGEHLKLTLKGDDGTALPGIWFRHGAEAPSQGSRVTALYTPAVNTFMERTNVQAEMKNMIVLTPGGKGNDIGDRAENEFLFERCRAFETLPVREASAAELETNVTSSPMGSLVITFDMESADAVNKRLTGKTDFYTGTYPADARPFNAVCVCPRGLPGGTYENTYFAGLPACLCGGGTHLTDIPVSKRICPPDKDDLRSIYKLLRSKGEGTYKNRPDILMRLRIPSYYSVKTVLGICVLEHMGLIRISSVPKGISLTVTDTRGAKCPPEEDTLFTALNG